MCIEKTMEAKSQENHISLLSQLRQLFSDCSHIGIDTPINAYLLPRTDAHQSEYLAKNDLHVQFLSGFSGSSAFTVITDDDALLWTDGRYFTQAEKQLGSDWIVMKEGDVDTPDPIEWVCKNVRSGFCVGFNPHLFSVCMFYNTNIRYLSAEAKKMLSRTADAGITAVPIQKNLVDLIWTDRPIPPTRPIISLNKNECGEDMMSKIERVRVDMRNRCCDTLVITLLDDVAWLLNIRGFDIPHNPVVFSVVILNFTDVFLFVDNKKITPDVAQHLLNVKIYAYEQAVDFLKQYHNQFLNQCSTHRVWLPDSTNFALASVVEEKAAVIQPSPIQLMKAVKNDIELTGLRNAGIRDSAVHVQFFLWLNRELKLGHHVTEDRAAKQIDYYRSQLSEFVSPSFETLSAVGEHAALPHYKHTSESSRLLRTEIMPISPLPAVINDENNEGFLSTAVDCDKEISSSESMDTMYLIDSGGQYRDGTTDVTRTIYVGNTPADEHFCRMFTLVLKCHIDLAALTFPIGISGIRLESAGRHALWNHGYDFNHGVGHGVGHFLNVHEFPPFIGYRLPDPSGVGIQRAMVYTIEPGYYELGHFGIRIENSYETVAVQSDEIDSQATNFLKHVPLTWIPIQKSLIVVKLLESKHVQWLNSYHNKCLELVGKYLQERGLQEEYNFLAQACTPL